MTSGSPVANQPLKSDTVVLRTLLKRRHYDSDTNNVLPDAYIPRPGKDYDGLSVDIATSTTEAELCAEAREITKRFNRTFGVVQLTVGETRSLDPRLDVIADPLENLPNHALLTGVPHQEQNPADAERLAGLLARISKIVIT